MTNQLATVEDNAIIESVVVGGDLSKLSPTQRVNYYRAVCQSLGLNPLTKPFDYINLNGKLTLYARKDAADQLRNINSISIGKPDIQFEDDWIIVTVVASNANGRTDSDVGVVSRKDMRGDFGNALMKAVTKAKRRVTLSICGLGFLDETEIETIPTARPVVVEETGEIIDAEQVTEKPAPAPAAPKNGGNGAHLMVKIGKNEYPQAWGKAIASSGLYKQANGFEVDGILQKLEVSHDYQPAVIVDALSAYLRAKANGDDPKVAALDMIEAHFNGLTELG